MNRLAAFVVSCLAPWCGLGQMVSVQTFGGSGNESGVKVALDSAGNTYLAGTTTSFDLPVLHAAQRQNPGTEIVYSPDAGVTWQPIGNVPVVNASPIKIPAQPILAVDPSDRSHIYVGLGPVVYRSLDAGRRFLASTLPIQAVQTSVTSLAIDARTGSLYVSASPGGVFKSTDGGATWANVNAGLPPDGFIASVVVDPFRANTLWAWGDNAVFLSNNGGQSWSHSPAPTGGTFSFDAVIPGVIYGSVLISGTTKIGVQKSTDGGQTWTLLNVPLSATFQVAYVVTDPVRSGYVYVAVGTTFYRSVDGGMTWMSFAFPGVQQGGLAIDPANPDVLMAGNYRSTDDGVTWSPTAVSRAIQPVFAPSGKGALYGVGQSTSDAFVAKFAPDGTTLLFSTYFGGMGNETVGGLQVDGEGNVWLAGSTTSADLPLTSGAFQTSLAGSSNAFVAIFSADGLLLSSTYLGGSLNDSVTGLAVDPSGRPWITGQTSSLDFPITASNSRGPLSEAERVFVSELDPSGTQLLFSSYEEASGPDVSGGIAVDATGNILITGSNSSAQAFLTKLDPSGGTIFSTSLGGTKPVSTPYGGALRNVGTAVRTDAQGNIYVAGSTSAVDFPVTAGAYQTSLHAGCTYPAFSNDTGLIGTIPSYFFDDVFVAKLSPDGQTLLYATLLGGSCFDRATDLQIGSDGTAYVVGETDSQDFPQVKGIEGPPIVPQYKSFIATIDPSGSRLLFSSYLSAGSAPSIGLGPNGVIYVGGDSGLLAQSQPAFGFVNPFPLMLTDAYLASIDLSKTTATPFLGGVENAFSLLPGPVAAGEIVALQMPGFVPQQPMDAGLNEILPLGTSLGEVQVSFDGMAAQVVTVSAEQVVCIVPDGVAGQKNTTIQVSVSGSLSNPLTVSVEPAALGLLAGTAYNADGTPNSQSAPAMAGSVVTVFLTGRDLSRATVATNYGEATPAALDGFVPGVWSVQVQIPLVVSGTTMPVVVSSAKSQSQTLSVWVQ